MSWEPESHHKDPMVNAVLNMAEQISRLADATNGLLYGLKYSKENGMSIAESIEKAGEIIAARIPDFTFDGVESAISEIADLITGKKS